MNGTHAVRLEHEYYGGPCSAFRIHWCASARRILENFKIDACLGADGVALRLGDSCRTADPGRLVILRLFGISGDEELFRCTRDLPVGNALLHVRMHLGEEEISRSCCRFESLPSLLEGERLRMRSGHVPCLCVDLETTEGELCDPLFRSGWSAETVVRLQAPAWRWKIFVSGDLVENDPVVQDLAIDPKERLSFRRLEAPAPCGTVAFLSDTEIPLRRTAALRLQLRSGRDGRILLRRIPSAAPGALGREILEDGRVITVAHSFVNP